MKRGLKASWSALLYVGLDVEENSPMKRGLKVASPQYDQFFGSVEENSPMKRGLKALSRASSMVICRC